MPFDIDDYTRWRLLEGLDDIGLTERNLGDIETFEAARPAWLPKALPVSERAAGSGSKSR